MTTIGWIVIAVLIYAVCVESVAIAILNGRLDEAHWEERHAAAVAERRKREAEGPAWAVIGGGIAGLYDEEGER